MATCETLSNDTGEHKFPFTPEIIREAIGLEVDPETLTTEECYQVERWEHVKDMPQSD